MAWFTPIARFLGLAGGTPPTRRRDFGDESGDWGWAPFSAYSAAGIEVNQATALKATTVMACVTMLAEDFAKCDPLLYRLDSDSRRVEASDHELFQLFVAPNDWQTWFEFAEMMQFSLVMRGNGYAVKIRDRRGRVVRLVPVNADWCALWESPEGPLYYRVTPNGLHLRAELIGQPFLIPAEDMLHVKGFSMNGLVGASRIALASDAVGLAVAYERQATQWFTNGAAPSGVLTTDNRLTDGAAERMAADWKAKKGGLQNAGSILILEQGLKYQQVAMTAQAAEFIASRNFQIQEITRIFRIPAHMIGDLQRATMNNIEQLSQEYINLTITGYTKRWAAVLARDWDLKRQGLTLDFDLSTLTRANITARYSNYARGITGGFLTQNEAREDDRRDPLPGGDKLLTPLNMSQQGSHATGDGADGGGRPPGGSADASVKPRKAKVRDFDTDQPRDDHGRWTSGGMTPDQAQACYDNGEVPEGWYIHGRAGSQELSNTNVIQATQRVDVADQYAGKQGSVWYMRPAEGAKVMDFSGSEDDQQKLESAIRDSWDKGTLPSDVPEYASADEAVADIAPQFSPSDIVNSAEAYDNAGWVNWLYENTGATFVKTPDGAVALDKSAIDAVKVPNRANANRKARGKRYSEDQPRGDDGKWVAGAAVSAVDPNEGRVVVSVYTSKDTADAVQHALNSIGDPKDTDAQAHEIQVPADAKPGDTVHAVVSDGGEVHGAFASKQDANAAAEQASQAHWDAHGPEFDYHELEPGDYNKVLEAWGAAHPDDPGGEHVEDEDYNAFAKQALGLAADSKAPYPGLSDANDYFLTSDVDGDNNFIVSVQKTKLRAVISEQ